MTTAEQFASTPYDYIIVGGGTAGLALAARLSEDPFVNVGVIEAGGWKPDDPAINIPGLCGSILANPNYDWTFMSVPQEHANNRPVFQPRGKVLGGSSAINFLGLNRAPAHEYDAVEALGNPGWNWPEFLKYMKKSETTLPLSPEASNKYTLAQPDPRWHGSSGPIIKAHPTHFNALHLAFTGALENLGIPKNTDAADGQAVGSSLSFAAVDYRTATRSYAVNGYYQPNASRKNLVLLTNAAVSKITFQPGQQPLIATGVEFVHDKRTFSASASKEVIVCAGAFQTPQILELSGIGNKQILDKFGVTTLLDLPGVGENLQDHVYVHTIHEIDPKYDTVDFAQEPAEIQKAQGLYQKQQGFLSSALAVLFGFIPADKLVAPDDLKSWSEEVRRSLASAPSGLKKQLEAQVKWFNDAASPEAELVPFPGFFIPSGLKPTPKSRYSSVVAALMHPLSRGSVHIASTDINAAPAIDPKYFSNPLDLQMLLAILKFTLKLYETSPLADAVRQQVAPSAAESADDAALVEYIKNNCGCVYHPLGTAAMMPREDGGVVDPNLKVYGTANLRVVDASVIPLQIAAHTQATVYAIAEKAADIIKEAHK